MQSGCHLLAFRFRVRRGLGEEFAQERTEFRGVWLQFMAVFVANNIRTVSLLAQFWLSVCLLNRRRIYALRSTEEFDFILLRRGKMKKLLALTFSLAASLASLGLAASPGLASEKGTLNAREVTMAAHATNPQLRIQIGRDRRDRRDRRWGWGRQRTVEQTRIVNYGGRTFRETYMVRYFPDGRTETTLINRERLRY